MRIGEMTACTGVTARLLRYYEEQELITPGRDRNGYRVYCPEGVRLIGQIRGLLAAGLPTRLIRDALPLLAGPQLTADAAFVARLRREAGAMQERIDDLAARRRAILEFAEVISSTTP
ncbi:MerR family transcriptional regulator [Winogradskya humida]|uniref:MerR family transcriptional regulator n=1 Tax=Winogradskya humida TaxID=113566 RepID=A0ABQ4A6P5_9ACTN|nr:MerR family transcriptional regulator [Actinoplanes humidus]GIE26524.1 MerR family transcriptional regulator [Actinoplanes humidus]